MILKTLEIQGLLTHQGAIMICRKLWRQYQMGVQ